MGVVEELIRAREAYDRREWLAAYDGLSDAAADVLTPDDFHQLATAAYLLGRRADPSDDEIREALSGNLCRCTGYAKIFDAVRLAAERA